MFLYLSTTNLSLLAVGLAVAVLNAYGDRVGAFIAGMFARPNGAPVRPRSTARAAVMLSTASGR